MNVRLSLLVHKRQTKRPQYNWKLFVAIQDLQVQYSIDVGNRFQILEYEECKDPSERYQKFIAANENATEKCVPRRVESRKTLRSRHPTIVIARERLKELQASLASSATNDEYRNNSQAVNEARKSLYSAYDQFMADDLE